MSAPEEVTNRRLVVEDVAFGETVRASGAGVEVEVLGDVHGTVMAIGGGARVIVHGDVHPGAQVGARGGSATVEIRGRVR